MFDNTNPYTIRFEETDGRKRYFVAFTDGQGNFQETEVSKAVYMEFCHFIKRERNLRRSDERHLEQSELTEETLCRRAVHKPKPVDDAVNDNIRMERLNRAIMELPEIQKRRFMLHFDLGLTYEQIAPRLSLPLSRAEYTQRQSCPPILLSEILRVLTRTLLFCLNRYVLLIRSVYRNISVCFPKVRWQELIRLLPLAFR